MDNRSLLTFWSYALQCLYLMQFFLFSQLGKLLNSVLSSYNLVGLRGHAFLILIEAITCVAAFSQWSPLCRIRTDPIDLVNNGALTQGFRSVLLFQCFNDTLGTSSLFNLLQKPADKTVQVLSAAFERLHFSACSQQTVSRANVNMTI